MDYESQQFSSGKYPVMKQLASPEPARSSMESFKLADFEPPHKRDSPSADTQALLKEKETLEKEL